MAPQRLVAGYRVGDFLLATGEHTIHATGVATELDVDVLSDDAPLTGALAASKPMLAVGALGFDTTDGSPAWGRLVVPTHVRTGPAAHPALRGAAPKPVPQLRAARPLPEPAAHRAAVDAAVARLAAGELAKVVLARAIDVTFADRVDPAAVLHNLVAGNPDGFTFGAALPGGATLLGSSPELLVRKSGRTVRAHPHAGTAPRSADPAVDDARARALAASEKNAVEHAVVVDAVVAALRPFCDRIDVPDAPSLTATPAVWHLGTPITAELSADVSALRLAAALHPTPAVCGTPTASAAGLIAELEPFDRQFYCGAVGWTDAAGDGEFAVSVRCGVLHGADLRLYAGGGIVAASDPDSELDETTVKFRTLLRAMGVADDTAV